MYKRICNSAPPTCHACLHSVAMCGWLLSFPPTQQSLVPKFTLLLSVYILIFEIWTFYLLSWSSLSTSLECIMHIVRHTYILANSGTPASGAYDWFRDYVIVRSQISNFQHLKGIEKYTWGNSTLVWCPGKIRSWLRPKWPTELSVYGLDSFSPEFLGCRGQQWAISWRL